MAKKQPRIPFFQIATGSMGIGKTYLTRKLLDYYIKAHPKRKVIIFDPNMEKDYEGIKTLYWDIEDIQRAEKQKVKTGTQIITKSEKYLDAIPPGEVRRILPFTIGGLPMDNVTQMRLTMLIILRTFRNGLIILEDTNKYIDNWEKTEIKACFKAIRHASQDIIMHMQSLNPLRNIHMEAARVVRMHYDDFDVDKIKNKIPGNYEILKISQLIVHDKYLNKGNKYFHLFAYIKDKKIKGVKLEQLRKACERYLIHHDYEVKAMSKEIAFKNNRLHPVHSDIEKARYDWIENRLQMYYS